jgi:hypothetical protein
MDMSRKTQQDTSDMMMPGPLGISMDRMGSGTTWIPDAVTLPAYHKMLGDWSLMVHGFVFGQFDTQSGPRGDDQIGSLNWGMVMLSRDWGGGKIQGRAMLSLDPLTVTNRGYPLLLQTGETYQGAALYDRQHPHDFWMELGLLYERPIASNLALSIYAAPSGEPALGPVAFMHRPSAMDNLSAPLSHHWQDATHISFGVLTGGLFTRTFKVEGSIFNGREPNEERWGFDKIKLDSYSGRVTLNPSGNWSLTTGYGYLKSPESLHPDESVHRMTASAMYGSRGSKEREWAATLVWGANKDSESSRLSHAFLAEGEFILNGGMHTVITRAEYVERTPHDLNFSPLLTERFHVTAVSAGYIREISRMTGLTLGLGALGTVNFVPAAVESIYGSRTPRGLFVFLRLRPSHLHEKEMAKMPGM